MDSSQDHAPLRLAVSGEWTRVRLCPRRTYIRDSRRDESWNGRYRSIPCGRCQAGTLGPDKDRPLPGRFAAPSRSPTPRLPRHRREQCRGRVLASRHACRRGGSSESGLQGFGAKPLGFGARLRFAFAVCGTRVRTLGSRPPGGEAQIRATSRKAPSQGCARPSEAASSRPGPSQ
jgi:hypothetical protein